MSKNLPFIWRSAGPALQPTRFGDFTISTYRAPNIRRPYYALVMGQVENADNVLARVHSACATGDIFRSLRCDCGEQLDLAQQLIATAGTGIIVYASDQEGRGIGEDDKIKAYSAQDDGLDTIDANLSLGHEADEREYGIAASVLAKFGIKSVKLMTNNPDKIDALQSYGIEVAGREPLVAIPTEANIDYLRTKLLRNKHMFEPAMLGLGVEV